MATTAPVYSSTEELIHALTAGLGIIACVVAIPWLAWVSAGDAPRMVAALVFGCSALTMFITSVIYHAARPAGPQARAAQVRSCRDLHLLIAGTYTPVTLVAMRDAWGWVLFASVWALAAFGIIAKTTVGFRFPRLSVFLYLGMGWLGVIAFRPIADSLSSAELAWIVAGGLIYTAGVPFYVWKSRRYTHAVWHLFVLGGVACHFAAVLSMVTIPAA